MLSDRFLTFVLLFIVPCSARAADSTLTLQQLPIADLAKAVRARGDAARGAVLFFQPFLACAKCHDGDTGTQFVPDIAKVGKDGTPE
jgi:hypothetical protein